ncbi:NADH dehydrogenase subunit L [Candidatus Koribacter versatilis Ellin345]|uniref:NADH dehydrogenase subunit L n=1 Tax=Koribacter versatilis (strain Ellin345) TaxID=204669 RepID=Q1IS54_KORVE|nr:NADH-quinone oxidoreductase subunit L [Candidatus Koribacter versatilis]ABF40296.1 NADH dehydrogenase subunit L [Candidatus Koribacter versatilis Ellin345]
MFFLEHIWLIPLFPALGAATMFFFGRKLDDEHDKKWVNGICVGAIVLTFLWSCLAVFQYTQYAAVDHKPFEKVVYTWLGSNTGLMTFKTASGATAEFKAEAGFLLDPLSSIWLLFVTGVGMLIHIYSTGYMKHDGGYYRFFGYLNLFMFSMLTLILGNNYAMMFVGWEGVGLCSYLLIGFYFHKKSASTAANKAFITNRIGDAGVLVGMFTIAWYFGSINFTKVTQAARSGIFHTGDYWITFATIALFIGACGKSAQLPLYVWLPDAMEGPTPVSALIHAATMVTAGVYMVARSNALYILAPNSMKVVAIVGALTAVFAASIGLVQNDIKRVLAYSTVSQLGYMFLALGLGAFTAGVFHVFTHAFFKALLFLGSGSVIHAMSGEQDMRFMGALRKKIPVTFWTMFAGTLAIAGIPPLAGFFSKDEILWQAWSSNGGTFRVLWGIGFLTALMTSLYMFRLVYLTFFGQPRMSHEVEHHVHESPKSMTGPLVILAICAVFAGFLGVPHSLGGSNRFEKFLEPVFANQHTVVAEGAAVPEKTPAKEEKTDYTEYELMLASIGAAGLGWLMANRAYGKADKAFKEPINELAPPVYNTLLNKYYVDEAYDYTVLGRCNVGKIRLGALGLGDGLWKFDANVIDGGVNGAGWMTRFAGTLSSWWDKWIIDGVLVNGPAVVARVTSYPVRLVQWGLVQWYALVMVFGVVGLVWYYVIR